MSFIGLLYIFLGAVGQYLINASRVVSLLVILASCLFAFLYYLNDRNPAWRWFAVCGLCNVPGLLSTNWYMFTVPAVWNIVFGLLLLGFGRQAWDIRVFRERERRKRRKNGTDPNGKTTGEERRSARKTRMFFRFLSSAGKGFVFIFAGLMLLNTFAPGVMLRFLRDVLYHTGNVAEAEQQEVILENGTYRIADIRYDAEYPNSFLDITYGVRSAEERPATVVFFHGGGFVWGDKGDGDPNARVRGYANSTIAHLTMAGYNVVSMNYALTPEYTYPTAIKQLNHGLRYLKEHAEDWKLNMQSVFFAGVSAGGNLEGVLANIQTNPLCAAVIGEQPVFTDGELKGVIFDSSLLDYHRFGETHNHYFDYLFYTMGRVYFHVNDLKHDRRMNDANVMEYLTEKFPPAFISDGNTATFYEQAFALYEGLNELGVYAELNYFPATEAGRLRHGFEEDGSEWAVRTMQNMLLFLERIDAAE